MQIKRKLFTFGHFLLLRVRTIILSLLLVYLFIHMAITASVPGILGGLPVVLAYLALQWMSGLLRDAQARTAAVIGLWILTMLYGILFDAGSLVFALVFYLIGYTAMQLPVNRSILLTAAIIAVDAVILFHAQEQPTVILIYSIIHAATFLLFWGARMKREAVKASKRHYEQLQGVHAELEQTHKELQQTHEELEEATVRLLRYAVLEERSRISRDLHDSIGQGLTSVIVQLQALPYIMKTNAEEAAETLQTALDVSRNCLQEVRTVVHRMAVDEEGLGLVALQSLIEQVREHSGLDIALRAHGPVALRNPEIAESLYRMLQETLTNVIHHAQAAQVEVDLSECDGVLTMAVTDDGRWTGDAPILPGFGLSGMKARCERAGGALSIQPAAPHGMKVVVKMPLHEEQMEGERE